MKIGHHLQKQHSSLYRPITIMLSIAVVLLSFGFLDTFDKWKIMFTMDDPAGLTQSLWVMRVCFYALVVVMLGMLVRLVKCFKHRSFGQVVLLLAALIFTAVMLYWVFMPDPLFSPEKDPMEVLKVMFLLESGPV